MWMIALCIIFFLSTLFVSFVFKDTFKQGKSPFYLILGIFALSALLAGSVVVTGLLFVLTFKGISYVFGHVIIFESNMTIFSTGLLIFIMYVVLELTVHVFLSVVSIHFFRHQTYGLTFYCVSRIAVDSVLLYYALIAIPGVELRNPYIAIFIATLFFLPDIFEFKKKKEQYEKMPNRF